MRIFGAEKLSIFLIGKFLSRLLNLSLVGLLLIIAPNNPGKLLYPPFRQCIFENSLFQNGAYLISFDNDNSSATIKVWSNFHFSFSIILCLVQKKWYVQKIPRGGWSGFGTALIWIDPNYFGSLCSNPNKIQTNDMVGGVIYFCLLGSLNWAWLRLKPKGRQGSIIFYHQSNQEKIHP